MNHPYRPYRIERGAYVPSQAVLAYHERKAERAAQLASIMCVASRLALVAATMGAVLMSALVLVSLIRA